MRLVFRIALVCALQACGGDKKADPAPAPGADKSAVDPTAGAGSGSIEGTIVLAEGATLPALGDPMKASKLVVTNPPAPCTPIRDDDLHPVKHDAASGGLSSVHVALTGMATTEASAPRVHEVRLENCRLNQALVAARLGDTLRITNASAAPLLPSIAGDSFMEAILANQSRTIELKRVGASHLSCSFGAYCGQSDVLVTSHSLFAVSDRAGHFRIDNVPLDRALTLHAWHPLFQRSSEQVTLTKDAKTRTVKLVLKPISAPDVATNPSPPATSEGKSAPKKIVVQ